MPEEFDELKEHVEKGAHDPSLKPVSLTMAICAVLVAVVSLLGHRAHTEELLFQNKATDNWAFYQAKNIRRHSYELFLDMLSISSPKDPAAADGLKAKYQKEIARYDGEQKQIEDEAKNLEKETTIAGRKGDRFDLGEVFLEVALVITSITLLTRRRMFWVIGTISGILGLAVAGTAWLIQ